MSWSFLVGFLGSCLFIAEISGVRVLKERRIPRNDFVFVQPSLATHLHEVVIAVRKRDLISLEQEVLSRSTPGSSTYQKWMSFDEVGEYISNLEAYNRVTLWLQSSGVEITWVSKRKDYIAAVAAISTWEHLLSATFGEFEDKSMDTSGRPHRIHRAETYYLPQELDDDIFALFNTVQTPPAYHPKYHVKSNSDLGSLARTDVVFEPHHLRGAGVRNMEGPTSQAASFPGYVTVSFINSYYDVTNNTGSASQQQSVFETSTQYYSTSDLQLFQESFDLPVQSAESIGNHQTTSPCPTTATSTMDCYEGNLDIQYIMGVSQVTASIYWWVSGTTTDPFVGWVTAMADETDPPKANSASWGANEQLESVAIMQAFNAEALQLAAMGVTVVASTGDNGAAALNRTGSCQCNADSSSSTISWAASTWSGDGYFPSFPATSPYVTAAGATMGPESGGTEIACQSQLGGVITTGGGFSTFFSQPSWQTTAVSDYFTAAAAAGTSPTSGYNPQGRAIPDISLIGVDYVIVIGNTFQAVYGTSCVAPVITAFVSLINAGRAAQGKSSIGWMNPTLYSVGTNNTQSDTSSTVKFGESIGFTDITSGHNKCCANGVASKAVCCASGFTATTGWDPVTGWGSVKYTNLAAMFDLDVFVNTTSSSSSSGGSSGIGGVSVLMIAGIAAAVVVLAAVVAFVWTCCCRQDDDKNNNSARTNNSNSMTAVPTSETIATATVVLEEQPPPRRTQTRMQTSSSPSSPPSSSPPSRPKRITTANASSASSTDGDGDRELRVLPSTQAQSAAASAVPVAAVTADRPPAIVIPAAQVTRQLASVVEAVEDEDMLLPTNSNNNVNGDAEDHQHVEERIHMANPMRGTPGRSGTRGGGLTPEAERNSMDRVRHLHRGLSLDAPQRAGSGQPLLGRPMSRRVGGADNNSNNGSAGTTSTAPPPPAPPKPPRRPVNAI